MLTFLGSEIDPSPLEEARAVVLPLPMESTVSYGGGTGRGPEAILEASQELEVWDCEQGRDLRSLSIHTLPALPLAADPAKAVDQIAEAASPHFRAGRFLLGLGGEHTVTAGLLQGLSRPEVGVLQLDAHADLRSSYEGSRFSHACVMRRAAEMGHSCVGVGIRSHSPEEAAWLEDAAYSLHYAHTLDPAGRWMETVVEALPEEVYLTVDVDVLDPSVLPGTGTPEPDGMSYRQVANLIDTVFARRRVVGADLVELAPVAGSHISEFTAARLALRMLAPLGLFS